MNKKMLDLFSGLGGASEAFLQHGWEVKRIENNPELALVPNTEIMDVQQFEDMMRTILNVGLNPISPTLIWASPPCTDFSNGYSSPKSIHIRNKRDGIVDDEYNPQEAIELVMCAKRIIDMLQPKYWIIENVRGATRYLNPILGEPKMVIDSIVLWGEFPTWSMEPGYKHKKDDAWSTTPLRANIRAKIPYAVSDACRQSIEHTKTLDYWW